MIVIIIITKNNNKNNRRKKRLGESVGSTPEAILWGCLGAIGALYMKALRGVGFRV